MNRRIEANRPKELTTLALAQSELANTITQLQAMHWEFQAPVIGSTPSGVICSPEDLRALFDDLLEEELVPMIMQLRAACAVVEDKLVRSKSVRNSSWRHLRIARLGSANALCGQACLATFQPNEESQTRCTT